MALPFISLGLGALKGITSLINKGNIDKQIKELEANRPKYSINPESKDELSLSESELAKGMSSRAERAYSNMAGADFANSLDAILKSGGSVNNIGALYGAGEQGRQKLALLEDEIRMRQTNNLIASRRNMSDQRDKAFMYNVDKPYQDKSAALGMQKQAAEKGIWEGLTTAGSAMMGWQQNQDEMNFWDRYLNPPQSNSGGMERMDVNPISIPQVSPIGGGVGIQPVDLPGTAWGEVIPQSLYNLNMGR